MVSVSTTEALPHLYSALPTVSTQRRHAPVRVTVKLPPLNMTANELVLDSTLKWYMERSKIKQERLIIKEESEWIYAMTPERPQLVNDAVKDIGMAATEQVWSIMQTLLLELDTDLDDWPEFGINYTGVASGPVGSEDCVFGRFVRRTATELNNLPGPFPRQWKLQWRGASKGRYRDMSALLVLQGDYYLQPYHMGGVTGGWGNLRCGRYLKHPDDDARSFVSGESEPSQPDVTMHEADNGSGTIYGADNKWSTSSNTPWPSLFRGITAFGRSVVSTAGKISGRRRKP